MVGETISHYKILEKLGEGGMGVVYKAEDTKLRRIVALKFLSHEALADEEGKARFTYEAQAAAALDHPNICTVHEIDEAEGKTYIAMAYVDGLTLKEKIAAGPLKLHELLDIAIQTVEGLCQAHEKGVIHRDIKPSNLMLSSSGQIKIMDFGLARSAEQTQITRTGTTLGTIAYMSPEQARGEEIDHRTDIWSFGVMLYQMLTGQLPFKGDSDQTVLYAIMNTKPESITGLRTGVPIELERIIEKALEPDKSHRYQHVDELLADLRRLRHASTDSSPTKSAAVPVGVQQRKSSMTRVALLMGVLAVVAVGIILLKPFLLDDPIVGEPTPVAVISFTNQTGEGAYDYLQEAIPNLLITNLEQSPYLRVTTWERMFDLLGQMGYSEVRTIQRDQGFQLCKLAGIRAIILGSFVKAGDVFATDVKVLDVSTKELITTANAKGQGVGSILEHQIDDLTREISRAIGLSERVSEVTPLHIADVTTTSMDAYNAYLQGRDALHGVYLTDAKRHLERAIVIDSTFAAAHHYLAITYSFLNDNEARDSAFADAMRHAEKATEKERLFIEASYAGDIERNYEKQHGLLRELEAKYPEDKRTHFSLARFYDRNNRYPETIRAYQRALELDPTYRAALNFLAYSYVDAGSTEKAIECIASYEAMAPEDANARDSMGDLYYRTGRIDAAVAKFHEALDLKSDFRSSALKLAYIHLLKEEYAEATEWIERFATMTPGRAMIAEGIWWKAAMHYTLGADSQALRELEQALDFARDAQFGFGEAVGHWLYCLIYIEQGDATASRFELKRWSEYFLTRYPSSDWPKAMLNYYLGIIDLNENELDSLQVRIDEMESALGRMDEGRWMDLVTYWRGLLRVELLIKQDELDEAIALASEFEIPVSMMMSTQLDLYLNPWLPEDALARAYVRKGELAEAIAHYESLMVPDPNQRGRRMIHPKYHYRVAKLHEAAGARQRAEQEYERFLAIWKDADEGKPELVDARERLTALRQPTP